MKNTTDTFFAGDLPDSVIKRLSLRIKATGGINLGQGIPSFPTPAHIITAVKKDLDNPGIGIYPNFLGTLELRQAVAKTINDKHGIQISENENVLITVGAMEATASAILSIVHTGERVGVVTPDYCNHFPQIALARGRLVEIASIESENWNIDLVQLEKEMKLGMKLLLLTNPNNPTGAVQSREIFLQIIALAKRYGTWLLVDETYSFLTYEAKFSSLLDYWDSYDRLITVRSFSKEYAMTGWRVGYLIASKNAVGIISRTHDALVGCTPKISQKAALAAITGSQECVVQFRESLQKLRDLACKILDAIPSLSYVVPQGAYYIFLRYCTQLTSVELCNQIIEEANVATVPGIAFGAVGEKHFRISFAVDEEILQNGLKKLAGFFNQYT